MKHHCHVVLNVHVAYSMKLKDRSTIDFLKSNNVNFWAPDMWPPSSPNLSPLDYGIWPRMVAEVNHVGYKSLNALKTATQKSWDDLDERFVRRVTGRFRNRLERVLEGGGEYLT